MCDRRQGRTELASIQPVGTVWCDSGLPVMREWVVRARGGGQGVLALLPPFGVAPGQFRFPTLLLAAD